MRLIVIILCLFSLVRAAGAAPISVTISNNINLALGTRNFGPIAVPDDVTVCSLSINRTQWTNPAAALSAQLEISVDGGATWQAWVGLTSVGSADATMATTSMSRALPAGTGRQIRGNYVVTGVRFRSTVTAACF
jgi:hypothetical protein